MSLYETALATYDASSIFNQTWSKRVIEIWTMPTVVANARNRQQQSQIMDNNIRAQQARPIKKLVKVNSQP